MKDIYSPYYFANRFSRYEGSKFENGDTSLMMVKVGSEIVNSKWFIAEADSFCLHIQPCDQYGNELDLYINDNYACAKIKPLLNTHETISKPVIRMQGNGLPVDGLDQNHTNSVSIYNLPGTPIESWHESTSSTRFDGLDKYRNQVLIVGVRIKNNKLAERILIR